MAETKAVKLTQHWAGRVPGHEFPLMDARVADLLVEQGRAEYLSDAKKKRKRKSPDSGTTDAGGSEATPVDKPE